MTEMLGAADADHQSLMNELYQNKSKWTHPTYSSIREVTEFCVLDGVSKIKGLSYGQCDFEYKLLELVDFYRSSIWTTFQIFHACFIALPLSERESEQLFHFDKIFMKWPRSHFVS